MPVSQIKTFFSCHFVTSSSLLLSDGACPDRLSHQGRQKSAPRVLPLCSPPFAARPVRAPCASSTSSGSSSWRRSPSYVASSSFPLCFRCWVLSGSCAVPVEVRGERVRRGRARLLAVDAGHPSQAKPESVPGWAASISGAAPCLPGP